MNEPKPSIKPPSDYSGMAIASILMIGIGWYGLFRLITTREPLLDARWLFFLLLHIAITGTTIPLARYLNIRLTPITRPLPGTDVIVRQSVWAGTYVVTLAWLQLIRVLTVPIMFFIALAFVVIEVFLRTREISR